MTNTRTVINLRNESKHCTLTPNKHTHVVTKLHEEDFTWSRLSPFLARRLDYCFTSETALNSCVACNHIMIPASDHKVVVMELNDRYWEFKNSLLKNISFVKMVNKRRETVIKGCDNNCSDTDTWELCKVEIRNFCALFGKKGSQTKKEMTFLSVIYKLQR